MADAERTELAETVEISLTGGLVMKSTRVGSKLEDEGTIAPVTILDAAGRVVRIVPAKEFRQAAAAAREGSTARASDDMRRLGGRMVRSIR